MRINILGRPSPNDIELMAKIRQWFHKSNEDRPCPQAHKKYLFGEDNSWGGPSFLTVLRGPAHSGGGNSQAGVQTTKAPVGEPYVVYQIISGSDLLSHPVSGAVPSALEGLTSLFGMGRGVAPPL